MRYLLLIPILFQLTGQPIIKDALIRDLMALYTQQVHGRSDENVVVSYHYSPDNEVLEIMDDGGYYDDAPIWRIVFTESLFNPFLSQKITADEDISDIESCVREYGIAPVDETWCKSYVFSALEVQVPPSLPDGETILAQIVRRRFEGADTDCIANSKIPFIAIVLVDQEGHATFESLCKSSDDFSLDLLAEKAVKEYCQNVFKPAIHRGQAVTCRMAVFILQSNIL